MRLVPKYALMKVPINNEGTPYNTKLINNGVLKSMSDIVCSAIDSLKKDCYLKMTQ
jgi:hypothetical protein